MPADKQDHDSSGFAQIKPTAIHLSRSTPATPDGARRNTTSPAVWIGLALLAVAAVVVIFILPGRMHPPALPASATAPKPATGISHAGAPGEPAATVPGRAGAAPADEAQLAKLRLESQDLLQEAIENQKALQEISVEHWAPADYAAAVQLTRDGDAAYRAQDFAQSRTLFEQAVTGLRKLQSRAVEVHAESLGRGRRALSEGQSAAAADAFRTALSIRPDDTEAASGLKRAGTLDPMRSLVAEGDALVQQDRLDEARRAYTQAGALDSQAQEPKRQMAVLEQIVAKRKFTAAMSRGYAALEKGEWEKAAGSFRDAVAVMPDAAEAKSALSQTQQKLTTAAIGKFLGEALEMEGAERWLEAMQRYESALALDPNLPQARQGKERAAGRVALDERLRAAIARPERLSDDAVHAEARALQQEASAITAPGPLLKKQIVVLGALLEQAVIPVSVTLHSDGATQVTVYKVGTLGQFESRELPLRPGRYVAIGKRPGYRDVRVEFSVSAGQAPAPVTVACLQRI